MSTTLNYTVPLAVPILGRVAEPEKINPCKVHDNWHQYVCVQVTSDLTVVLVCQCGSVVRDHAPEGKHDG